MTNEDGSFDYSQMGRRPVIIIEAFALKLMETAGVDMPTLRERLIGLSANSIQTEINLGATRDATSRGGRPVKEYVTCRRIMRAENDEIVVEFLDIGHGLTYKGDQRWPNPESSEIKFTVEGQHIPETVINQSCGKPLTSLIKHQILDDDSFIVRDITNRPTGVDIAIVPSWVKIA